jgi:hypothetical protein
MPVLFKYLNDDAFLIFSRGNRHLYEACLLEIYARYFEVGTQFPTPQEIVHVIYDVLGANPQLVDDEGELQALPEIVSSRRRRIRFVGVAGSAGDKALKLATHLYSRLLATGWLEEEEYGLRVTVDMPMGALLVTQRLVSLKTDITKRFGGVVVQIKISLENAAKLAAAADTRAKSDASQALDVALEHVSDFTKTLRAILSDLKRIRRSLLEAPTLKDRIATYFDQFIGELLLKDFQSILTTNHPYRYRDRIIDLARTLSLDERVMQALSDGYVTSGISRTADDGRRQAHHKFFRSRRPLRPLGRCSNASRNSAAASRCACEILCAMPSRESVVWWPEPRGWCGTSKDCSPQPPTATSGPQCHRPFRSRARRSPTSSSPQGASSARLSWSER